MAFSAAAQAVPNAAYEAKRQRASELFEQGKRLDALPLLEDLVEANPKDDAMLVALASCLIDHAATLADQMAAGKERVRARDLLNQAIDLGNTSPLTMNLSQLLKQLPSSGSISFSDNPRVEQAMREGEAAFSSRDFTEAIKNYQRALDLEPGNYTATLFVADAYHKLGQAADAMKWYERAIQLDQDNETAFRYYADLLAEQGNMSKSRAMLIQAAVAEPYNRIVWRELRAWASLNNVQLNQVYIGIPAGAKSSPSPEAPIQSQDASSVWQAYYAVKAKWQKGDEFNKYFPAEKVYRHSLLEESQALAAAANMLEKLEADKKFAASVAADPALALLARLHQAGLIESYVLFSLGDSGIARDYAAYRAANHNKLEEYMNKLVVPPAP